MSYLLVIDEPSGVRSTFVRSTRPDWISDALILIQSYPTVEDAWLLNEHGDVERLWPEIKDVVFTSVKTGNTLYKAKRHESVNDALIRMLVTKDCTHAFWGMVDGNGDFWWMMTDRQTFEDLLRQEDFNPTEEVWVRADQAVNE